MKRIFLFFMLLISAIHFAQVNVEEIKKNVIENPQKYYYENVMIFKTNPESMSQEQLNYVYYGFNYVDYGYKRSEYAEKNSRLSKIASRNVSKKVALQSLEDANYLYGKTPHSLNLLNNLVLIYSKAGDQKQSDLHAIQYQLISKTIEKSGNGLLEETPLLVTNFSDKFFALENFSKIFVPGITFKIKVLEDGSSLDIFKNGLIFSL